MKAWEHCAKAWHSINLAFAIEDIKRGSIVRCIVNDQEYLFNIPGEINPSMTDELIYDGKWYVYTWAD